MKITLSELRSCIKEALSEGTIEVHPMALKPGDILNGRCIAKVKRDVENREFFIITYEDGGTVRMRRLGRTNREKPRIDRPGVESAPWLQKIPAGWGKKE